jgi:hypothetical protein
MISKYIAPRFSMAERCSVNMVILFSGGRGNRKWRNEARPASYRQFRNEIHGKLNEPVSRRNNAARNYRRTMKALQSSDGDRRSRRHPGRFALICKREIVTFSTFAL